MRSPQKMRRPWPCCRILAERICSLKADPCGYWFTEYTAVFEARCCIRAFKYASETDVPQSAFGIKTEPCFNSSIDARSSSNASPRQRHGNIASSSPKSRPLAFFYFKPTFPGGCKFLFDLVWPRSSKLSQKDIGCKRPCMKIAPPETQLTPTGANLS